MSEFIFDKRRAKATAAFHMDVTSNIEKAEALLRGIPGGAEKALDKAILAVRRQHARFAEKALLREYNVTSAMLHKKEKGEKHARITPKYKKIISSAGHGFAHEVVYSTFRIPLAEFIRNPQDKRTGPAKPIRKTTWAGHPADLYHFRGSVSPSVHVRKDTAAEKVTRSFIARVQAGKSDFHIGIFERTEARAQIAAVNTKTGAVLAINGDSPISQKYSLSVSEMLANSEEARDYIDQEMSRSMDAALDDKIRAILDGRLAV